jgi:prophage antirepressor-like protein
MNGDEQYPARVEQFHAVAVNIYEIDGKDYLTGEDIGRCLGLTLPRKSVTKIYQRNREELEPHKAGVNLGPPSGNQEVMVFTETGANLIGMFSRTAKSKDFRLWLARLPRRVRDAAPQIMEETYVRGLHDGLSILAGITNGEVDVHDLAQLVTLRRAGFTQKQVALHLGTSRDQVQVMEHNLQERGITFPPVRKGRQRRQMLEVLVGELTRSRTAYKQIPPSPPLLKGGDKDHRLEACATGGL